MFCIVGSVPYKTVVDVLSASDKLEKVKSSSISIVSSNPVDDEVLTGGGDGLATMGGADGAT